jgi:hypothetical protein
MTELLSLSTIVKAKDTVTIESKLHPKGRSYDLFGLDDLSPIAYQTVVDRSAIVDSLVVVEKQTVAQTRELGKALADILKIIAPDMEPSVLAGMSNVLRHRIVVTWGNRVSALAAERMGATVDGTGDGGSGNPSRRRTTAASSRSSKKSTAATRKRGSTRRRG